MTGCDRQKQTETDKREFYAHNYKKRYVYLFEENNGLLVCLFVGIFGGYESQRKCARVAKSLIKLKISLVYLSIKYEDRVRRQLASLILV